MAIFFLFLHKFINYFILYRMLIGVGNLARGIAVEIKHFSVFHYLASKDKLNHSYYAGPKVSYILGGGGGKGGYPPP